MQYSLRQARNELGRRIVTNLEDEDIEVLFEDVESDVPYKLIRSGPPGHEVETYQYGDDPLFKNKENVRNMEKAREELIKLIREWMSFHGKVEWP